MVMPMGQRSFYSRADKTGTSCGSRSFFMTYSPKCLVLRQR
jgi:hypothetical protein